MTIDTPGTPENERGTPSPRLFPAKTALIFGIAVGVVIIGGATAAIASHVRSNHHHSVVVTQKKTQPSDTSQHSARHLQLTGISPLTHAKGVSFDARITLTFSQPIAKKLPKIKIVPAIAGKWSHPAPDKLVFTPSGNLAPLTVVHVFVPGGSSGIRSTGRLRLQRTIETGFTVEEASITRLQQLLAQLNYLPVGFAPPGSGSPLTRATSALSSEPTDPTQISLTPAPGSFVWRFPNIPAQLRAAFTAEQWNTATEGALMAFQYDHNLDTTGEPTNVTWSAVLQAVAAHKPTTHPYDYLLVSETLPETLYVWQEGKVIYQSPANTGVAGATTALGTFPVYLRYTSTTMSGTNPDGSHYVDPGIPWVSYFNGNDAVHGFIRAGYGYPQSDGCVELPYANAAKVYPLDNYGTLVTVTTGNLAGELGAAPPTEIVPTPAPTPTTTPTTPTTSPTTTTTTLPAIQKKKRPKPVTTTTTTIAPTTTTTIPTTTVPPAAGSPTGT